MSNTLSSTCKTGFFEAGQGERSSKRLVFIVGAFVVYIGFLVSVFLLIWKNHPSEAVTLWGYFLVYNAVLGGLVTTEVLRGLVEGVLAIKYGKVPAASTNDALPKDQPKEQPEEYK